MMIDSEHYFGVRPGEFIWAIVDVATPFTYKGVSAVRYGPAVAYAKVRFIEIVLSEEGEHIRFNLSANGEVFTDVRLERLFYSKDDAREEVSRLLGRKEYAWMKGG
jgi:hypothetical protein